MFILILALIFGAAVLYFTIRSYNRAKGSGGDSKLINILKLVVLAESILYVVLFAFVFLKTLFM